MRRLLAFAASIVSIVSLSAEAASPLAAESSPFLRSYADSPVSWQPWNETTFARARQDRKAIFLAVGLFNSELSRAMARQTFANADNAAFLNENFVCILVDAKERPDLVALYQNYLQSVKQLTGLPMNLWLTPELTPFEGANYLPPTEEWGKEGFLTVARRAAAGWTSDPSAQRAKAAEAVATVAGAQRLPKPISADSAAIEAALAEARDLWRIRFDETHGGFGESPKYPEPELLRFLLADPATRDLALATLRAFVHGATRDPIDGGFFRYGSDVEWRLPYFQKLLADQARISLALLDAAKISGDSGFSEAARDALGFVLGQLALDTGGFATALDATSEPAMESHLWTIADVESAVGASSAPEIARALHILPEGNLPPDAITGITTTGKNLPYVSDADTANSIASARAKLLAHRHRRAAPSLDGDAPSGHHGLLLGALARAGAELNDARLTAAATRQFAAMRDRLLASDGSLLHLAGASTPASPADLAMVVDGLLLHAAAADSADARTIAQRLLKTTKENFFNADVGRFYATTENTASGVWARVFAPSPGAGEPPSAEVLLLPLLGSDAATVASALTQDVKNSPEAPRGELLLALRMHRQTGR